MKSSLLLVLGIACFSGLAAGDFVSCLGVLLNGSNASFNFTKTEMIIKANFTDGTYGAMAVTCTHGRHGTQCKPVKAAKDIPQASKTKMWKHIHTCLYDEAHSITNATTVNGSVGLVNATAYPGSIGKTAHVANGTVDDTWTNEAAAALSNSKLSVGVQESDASIPHVAFGESKGGAVLPSMLGFVGLVTLAGVAFSRRRAVCRISTSPEEERLCQYTSGGELEADLA